MTAQTTEATTAPAGGAARRNVEAILPLLPLQNALLLRSGAGSTDPGVLQVRATLAGQLDCARLRCAWELVAAWQPALRMSIPPRPGAEPLAVVWRATTLPWETLDLRADDGTAPDQRLACWLEQEGQRGLSPHRPPCMRLAVLRTGDARYELVWTCHHLFIDGWSAVIVMEDVIGAYRTLGAGETPDPPLTSGVALLRAFHAWNQDRDAAATEAYWRAELAGHEPAAPLRLGPVNQHAVGQAEWVATLDQALVESMRATASQRRVTPSAAISCAWAMALGAVQDRDDVTFGTSVAGRSAPLSGLDRLAGCFTNVLPVRVRLDPRQTLDELMTARRDHPFRMQVHEQAGLADIHGWSGAPGHRTLFDSLLIVESFPFPAQTAPVGDDVLLAEYRSGLTSTLPLTLAVLPHHDWWQLRCLYDRARFSDIAIEQLVDRMIAGLRLLATAPELTLAEARSRLDREAVLPTQVHVAPTDTCGSAGYVAPRNETELRMVGVWEEVLGLTRIGVTDDYFALGGTSLIATRLFARIESAFGTYLPLSALLRGATVEAMTALLSEGDTSRPLDWKCLVPLRSAGSRPPLFCVHAGGGEVLFYRELARQLGDDQPVYGLQPLGLVGREQPLKSLPEMARRYLEEIRAAFPEGPYRLVGYCIGAPVCLEMTRQLEAAGAHVDVLVMIDSGLSVMPGTAPQRGPLDRLRAELRRLRRWLRARKWNWLDPEIRRLARHQRVERACRAAHDDYEPGPCQAPITLIRSTEYVAWAKKAKHLEWDDFTPRLEVEVVEGEHDDILTEPAVQQVARRIRQRVERSCGDVSPTDTGV